ncbi:hypothetical protein FRC02_010361 [Tulasnella sp. 418]|nr:hypothetical protein FRC02_010361 [Tulasnella sp. 418]
MTIFLTLRLFYDPYYLPLIRAYMTSSSAINVGMSPSSCNITLLSSLVTQSTVIDLFITSTVTIRLLHSKKGLRRETEYLVTRLIALTWESALPPTICALLNLIIVLTERRNALAIFFNMLTPRLYVFSVMYTLNSRPLVRSGLSINTSYGSSTWTGITGTKQTSPHLESQIEKYSNEVYQKPIPFNDIQTILVHVEVETISYTSNADYPLRGNEIQSSVYVISSDVRSIESLSKAGDVAHLQSDLWSMSSSGQVQDEHEYDMYHHPTWRPIV